MVIAAEEAYANCPELCPDKINPDRADPTKGDFAECDACERNFHLNCIGYPVGSSNKIRKFVCSSCRDDEHQTIWMALEPNRRKMNEKAREYYDVSAIVAHRLHRSYREFKVRWSGYSPRHDSWLRERDLDGAIDILQDYCVDHSLELSNIEAFVGSSSSEANPDAWITIQQAIECYKKVSKTHCRFVSILPAIKINDSSDLPEETSILFMAFEHHCYVGLYQPNYPIIYVADGSNKCESVEVRESLRSILGRSLQVRYFNQQVAVDHCGSSATLIALELARGHKLGRVPKELVASDKLARQVRQVHPAPSQLLATIRRRKLWLTCPYCEKKYANGSRRSYFSHIHSHTRTRHPIANQK